MRTMMMLLTSTLASLLLAGLAPADVILLRNGNRLEGKLRKLPDGQVEIRLSYGRIVLPAAQIAAVHTAQTRAGKISEALGKLAPTDAAGRYRLAQRCHRQYLYSLEQRLLREVIARDPDHAGARRTLGFKRHEGRWLDDARYHAALGQVRFRGRWITRVKRDAILAEKRARAEQAASKRRDEKLARNEAARRAGLQLEIERLHHELEHLRYRRYIYIRRFHPVTLAPEPVIVSPPKVTAPTRVQTPRPIPPILLPHPNGIPPLPVLR